MNSDDIVDILSGLNDEDFASLNAMAEQFIGKDESSSQAHDIMGGIDPQTVMKLLELLPLLQNSGDDDRTRLICALKPLLSPQRRKKADEAMQILRLTDIISLLQTRL